VTDNYDCCYVHIYVTWQAMVLVAYVDKHEMFTTDVFPVARD